MTNLLKELNNHINLLYPEPGIALITCSGWFKFVYMRVKEKQWESETGGGWKLNSSMYWRLFTIEDCSQKHRKCYDCVVTNHLGTSGFFFKQITNSL